MKPVASQDSITVDKGIGARGKSYNPSRLQAGSNKDPAAECYDQTGDLGEPEGAGLDSILGNRGRAGPGDGCAR